MSIELVSVVLFAAMFFVLFTGLPIAFSVGAVSSVFAIALWGPERLPILVSAAFSALTNVNLAAIPLFVFLGWVFKSSGVGDDLVEAVWVWLGNVPGGLGAGCLLISVLLAAITGDLVATTFLLANIALPPMLKRGYDLHLTLGIVAVGGLLGLIIPPSIETIIYASAVGMSVGKMYLGTTIPGLLMATLYTLYVLIICRLNPRLGPPAPPEKRIGWQGKIASLKAVVLPLLLVLTILGGIYSGIMSPLEAAAVGAAGAVVVAAVGRRLTWQVVKESAMGTVNLTGMLAWLLMAVATFTSVYEGIGAPELAAKVANSLPGGGWGTMAAMQIALLAFGMILDDVAIILIFGPIFGDVIKVLGFDPLWYGVIFLVNMNLAFLTPPYGFSLFYTKVAVPKEYGITMLDIYRGALPFVGLGLVALLLVIAFPPLATFLPNLLIGGAK